MESQGSIDQLPPARAPPSYQPKISMCRTRNRAPSHLWCKDDTASRCKSLGVSHFTRTCRLWWEGDSRCLCTGVLLTAARGLPRVWLGCVAFAVLIF